MASLIVDPGTNSASTWTDAKEKVVLGPYDYLLAYPGKDIRKQLISAFNHWFKVPEDILNTISNVVAMLHTASLLVDDVEDSSILRRGVPVAHNIFGVAQTINSANYVYFRALAELGKMENPKCLLIYTEELLSLHRGQGMDLYWRDNLCCPTEEDYLEMVKNKTGGLFRLAVKLMQISSECDVDYVAIVDCIGMIFQIRDDYVNLQSSNYQDTKGYCEDLTEGKFSFPIIHSIRTDPNNIQLINILRRRTEQVDVKKYAVEYMEKQTDSFSYTRKALEQLQENARKMIEDFGGNPQLTKILDKLVIEN